MQKKELEQILLEESEARSLFPTRTTSVLGSKVCNTIVPGASCLFVRASSFKVFDASSFVCKGSSFQMIMLDDVASFSVPLSIAGPGLKGTQIVKPSLR